jgi:hypothetical protein
VPHLIIIVLTKTLAILFVLLILILPIIVDSIWVPAAASSAIQKPASTTPTLPGPLISDALLGVILGGIIGFGSSIGADAIKDWRTRPIVSMSDDTTEVGLRSMSHPHPMIMEDAAVLNDMRERRDGDFADFIAASRDIHSTKPGEEYIPKVPEKYVSWFIGTRIKVSNKGKTAAEECKASLLLGDTELRIAWMIPKEDFTVTINADDIEYIDLCMIPVKPRNSREGTRYFTSIRAGFPLEADYREKMIGGLGTGLIEAKLKVSAKNAKQCIQNIWITDVINIENKIVFFKKDLNYYKLGFDYGRLFGFQGGYFADNTAALRINDDFDKGYAEGYKQGNDEGVNKKREKESL